MTIIYGLQDVVVRRITEAATDAKIIIIMPQIDIKSLDVSTSVSRELKYAFSGLKIAYFVNITFDGLFNDIPGVGLLSIVVA